MEIKVNIPQNDYVQPTDVREDVVQQICDIFLDRRGGFYHSIFHPISNGNYRRKHIGLLLNENTGKAFDFSNCRDSRNNFVRIHGVEMKAAFKALIDAGYYMFKVYEYGTWMGYVCNEKPSYEGGMRVFSFDEFID